MKTFFPNLCNVSLLGGDKVPRKGGPGITQSDLLVVNKTDLAEAVGADLKVFKQLTLSLPRKCEGDAHTVQMTSYSNFENDYKKTKGVEVFSLLFL